MCRVKDREFFIFLKKIINIFGEDYLNVLGVIRKQNKTFINV